MKRAYKIEIKPTKEQADQIRKTIGVCRYIYNFYIAHNQEIYKIEKKFISGMDFSKWLNNEYIPNNPDKFWIKEVSSKAVKQSIMNADLAFNKFFKGKSNFPKFKKKNKQTVKAYFPKNNKTDWTFERHKIKIPTIGWVKLKEFGYMPTNTKITSGTVSQKADRYYVSVLIEEYLYVNVSPYTKGIGIDLGLKEFAVISDGNVHKNINKTVTVKKLEKKLKREQRKLSRKYENLKIRTKTLKGVTTQKNIQKQIVKVQKIHSSLTNIRTDYINKVINDIVKQKPRYITIEDLNIRGMMKNKHLSKAVSQQKFYEFRKKLTIKGKLNNIEIRIADKFYPSSKICSCCGSYKKDLKLSDRVYRCNGCNAEIDRDLNAAINLENAIKYKIA